MSRHMPSGSSTSAALMASMGWPGARMAVSFGSTRGGSVRSTGLDWMRPSRMAKASTCLSLMR